MSRFVKVDDVFTLDVVLQVSEFTSVVAFSSTAIDLHAEEERNE